MQMVGISSLHESIQIIEQIVGESAEQKRSRQHTHFTQHGYISVGIVYYTVLFQILVDGFPEKSYQLPISLSLSSQIVIEQPQQYNQFRVIKSISHQYILQ